MIWINYLIVTESSTNQGYAHSVTYFLIDYGSARCSCKGTQKTLPLRWLATASSPWREQRIAEIGCRRAAEPLRATHIFLSEAGALFWSGVCRQVNFSFWWGTTWPHGPSSRERRNSRRIKGSRGFCDEGVEGLNRVYVNILFLWRVPTTNLFQVIKCCLSL